MYLPQFKSKQLTPSKQKFQGEVFKIIKELRTKKGYIKGYDTLFRVMDQAHNPIININKQTMECLKLNKIVQLDGLVYKPTEAINGIILQDMVKLD